MERLSHAGRMIRVLVLAAVMIISMGIPTYYGFEEAHAASVVDTNEIGQVLSGTELTIHKSWLSSSGRDMTEEVNSMGDVAVNIYIPFYLEMRVISPQEIEVYNSSEYKLSDNVTAIFDYKYQPAGLNDVGVAYGRLHITLNNGNWDLSISNLLDKLHSTYIDLYDEISYSVSSESPISTLYFSESTSNIITESSTYAWEKDEENNTFLTFNVTNVIKTKDITANKVWENMDGTENTDAHPTIYLRLYRSVNGGEPQPVENAAIKELKDGETTAEWDDMLAEDKSGSTYTYTVKEVDQNGNPIIPDGYIKKEDGLTVTNTKIPLNDITADKVWKNMDGTTDTSDHPTIYFKLYRSINGGEPEAVEDAELIELTNGTTTATWNDMPACDNQGNPYTYSVKETDASGNDAVPEDYEKIEDGLTVINTNTIAEIGIKGSDTPKKTNNNKGSSIVRTGDPDNIYLTAGIGLLALIAAIVLIRFRRAK